MLSPKMSKLLLIDDEEDVRYSVKSTSNATVNEIEYICNNGPTTTIVGIDIYSNAAPTIKIKLIDRCPIGIVLGSLTKVLITSGITNCTYAIGIAGSNININGCSSAVINGNTTLIQGKTYNTGLYPYGKLVVFNFNYIQPFTTDTNFYYNYAEQFISLNGLIYKNYDTIMQDTGTTYSGNNSWKLSIKNGSQHTLFYTPIDENSYFLPLTIGKVYVAAGSPVTVSAYMKNSSATAIGGKLYMAPYQLSGLTTELNAYSTSTNWTKINLPTFTPLEAGVIEIQAHAWYISSTTDSVWVDKLEIIQ